MISRLKVFCNNWLNSLSLRFRLVLSFASLILIFMCVGLYNYSTIGNIKAKTANQTVEANKVLEAVKVKLEVEDLSLFLAGFLLSKDVGMKQEYENRVKSLKDNIESIGKNASSPEERKWIAQLGTTLTEYAGVFDQAETIINDKKLTPIEVNNGMERLYKASQLHKEFVFETLEKFIQKFSNDSNFAKTESDKMLSFTGSISMVVPIIVFVLALIVAYLLVRSFTRPIKELQTIMNRISQGDLSHTINTNRKDELGKLSQSFNIMIRQVRDMLTNTRTIASSLSGHSQQFHRFSQETAAANTSILHAIEEISSGADQQAKQSETSTHIISDLENEIQEISNFAQSMQLTSSMAEQNTVMGKDSVNALSAAAADTEQRVSQVVQAMQALAASSAEIGNIINTITEISTQTNVLSLNAAIEAARAGAYGRGFSVIAEEVRVLSQQSNDSAKHISSIIKGLQSQISDLEAQLGETKHVMLNQNTRMESTMTAFSAIQSSMLEVSTQISSVNGKVDAISSKNKELIQSVQHVAAIAEETAAGVEEVNCTYIQQDVSIRQIADQAEDINQLSQQLFGQISKFIIDTDEETPSSDTAEETKDIFGETKKKNDGERRRILRISLHRFKKAFDRKN